MCIATRARVYGSFCRLPNILGSREIRLTHAKRENVHALRPERFGALGDGDSRGRLNPIETLCEIAWGLTHTDGVAGPDLEAKGGVR